MQREEIVLNGKKLLSLKMASRETGYTNDYIGQLCRGGLIDSQMVGRARFVDIDSLFDYVQSINNGKTYKNKNGNNRVVFNRPKKNNLAKTENNKSSNSLQKTVPQNRFTVAPLAKNNLVSEKGREISSLSAQSTSKSQISPVRKTIRRVAVLVSIILFLSLGYFFSEEINTKISSLLENQSGNQFSQNKNYSNIFSSEYNESQVASVSNIFDKVALSIYFSINNSIAGLKNINKIYFAGDSKYINDQNKFAQSSQVQSGQGSGIVVFESTGKEKTDEEKINDIKNNFSDEVDVYVDESGTSGVITPIFKEVVDDEYVYVLVPINKP